MHLFKDILVASKFWRLWISSSMTLCKFLHKYMILTARSYSKDIFSLKRNCLMIFHLCSHSQCMRIPVTLHPCHLWAWFKIDSHSNRMFRLPIVSFTFPSWHNIYYVFICLLAFFYRVNILLFSYPWFQFVVNWDPNHYKL